MYFPEWVVPRVVVNLQGRTGTVVLRLTPKFSTSLSAGAPAPPATKVTNIEQR